MKASMEKDFWEALNPLSKGLLILGICLVDWAMALSGMQPTHIFKEEDAE